MYYWAYYAPFLIGGGIKQCFCLTSLCLSVAYIGPKSRTERPRNTKISTEVDHVTRDSDTTFKVKRSNVKITKGALLSADLTHKAAAAVSVRTYSASESTVTLRLLGRARLLGAHGVEERGESILCRHAHSFFNCVIGLNYFKTNACVNLRRNGCKPDPRWS